MYIMYDASQLPVLFGEPFRDGGLSIFKTYKRGGAGLIMCIDYRNHKQREAPIVIGENMRRVVSYAASIGGYIYSPNWNTFNGSALSIQPKGRKIIDIGPDFARRDLGRAPCEYYCSDRKLLEGYPNYSKVFIRTDKYAGGVPGFDW